MFRCNVFVAIVSTCLSGQALAQFFPGEIPGLPGAPNSYTEGAGDRAGQSLTPPLISPVDEFGSNIMTGEFTYSVIDLSIGPSGSGGLSHGRMYAGMGDRAEWRDLNAGTIKYRLSTVPCYQGTLQPGDPPYPCAFHDIIWSTGFRTDTVDVYLTGVSCEPSHPSDCGIGRDQRTIQVQEYEALVAIYATVSIGHTSVQFRFDWDAGTYTPFYRPEVSLTKAGQIYTFIDGAGVQYQFSAAYRNGHAWNADGAVITEILYPNGDITTYHHQSVALTSPSGWAASRYRVQSITNNRGFQLHYAYVRDTATTHAHIADWMRQKTVTAINRAEDYCAVTANACTGLNHPWPSVTYTYTGTWGTKYTSVTNSLGQKTDYEYKAISGGGLAKIKGHTGRVFTDIAYYPRTSSTGANELGRPHVRSIEQGGVKRFYDHYEYTVGDYTPTNSFEIKREVRTAGGDTGLVRYAYSNAYRGITRIEVFDHANVATGPVRWTEYERENWLSANKGRLNKTIDHTGRETHYSYDGRNNVTEVRRKAPGLADLVVKAGYPASCTPTTRATCNQPLWSEDVRGFRTDFSYDNAHGGMTKMVLPAPYSGGYRPETRYGFATRTARYKTGASSHSHGSPIHVPMETRTCTSGNNSCVGEDREWVSSIGYQSSASLNNILPLTATTRSGNSAVVSTTTTGFDLYARPVSIDGPLSGAADTTHTRYDLLGRVTMTAGIDPDGSGPRQRAATRTIYDSDGLLTQVEQGTMTGATHWGSFAVIDKRVTEYNADERVSAERFVTGATVHTVTQYAYDSGGRTACTAFRMDPSTFASLPTNACLQTAGASPRDRITQTSYNRFGEPAVVYRGVGTARFQATKTLTYTSAGQLDTITDANGNLTKYAYDTFGRLTHTYFPHQTTAGSHSTSDFERRDYTDAGLLLRLYPRGAGGNHFLYAYDNLGRRTSVDAPGSTPDTSFTYDHLGRMLTASQPGHTLTSVYDALGRLTSETGPKGEVGFKYDAASRLTRMDYPGLGGFFVTYDYNPASQLTHIREQGALTGVGVLASYEYDDQGRVTSLTRGNGVETRYSYDAQSRLTSLVNDLTGTAHDRTSTFGYNTASQITSWTNSNLDYAYPHVSFAQTFTLNGLNQATHVTGSPLASSLSHDVRGNMTHDGTQSYSYDHSNRMTSAGSTSLAYDPASRLYQVGSTSYLYDGADLIAEYSGSTVLRRYVHGLGVDEPLVQYDGTGTSNRTFLIADERGSIIAGTNNAGNRTYVNRYDEYGLPWSGNTGLFQYTGQIWLPAAGLYHYKARAYNPELGRFMQTDPIGYGDGMNMYAYVGNDPVNMADPNGDIARAIVSAFKIAKRTVEHRGNVFKAVREEALDIADAAVTIFDSDASGFEKAAAVVSVVIGVNVGGRNASNVTNSADDFVDLATPQRRKHILDGDATGGGHRAGTGNPGKSEFPADWTDDRIMHEISDVATDPNAASRVSRGGRVVSEGTRDGITIRTVVDKDGEIITGYPTNVRRNP